MLSFESEIEALRARIGDAAADALIARERREVFSVHPEVRIAAWVGALLVAGAVGVYVKAHFAELDRRVLAVLLALFAAACFGWAWGRRGVVVEYVVLLGALILSADAGFIEQQFDLFGGAGHRHFLLLALLHGVVAYLFDSRLVLSLSIAALAAWMGLEQRRVFELDTGLALRAFACAAIVLVWRRLSTRPGFARLFEHFAANLALWGGLAMAGDAPLAACLVTLAIAAAVMWWGFRERVESFVLYAFVYAVIAVDVWLFALRGDELLILFLTMISAVPALILIHRRFRSLSA